MSGIFIYRYPVFFFSGFLFVISCIHPKYSEQDITIQYHLSKVESLSMIDIPDKFNLKSYYQTTDGSFHKIGFQLTFPANEIKSMSDQFRLLRRKSTGPGWGKSPLGWEFFHQPLMDEQFKLRIDTLSQQVEYSYIMAY